MGCSVNTLYHPHLLKSPTHFSTYLKSSADSCCGSPCLPIFHLILHCCYPNGSQCSPKAESNVAKTAPYSPYTLVVSTYFSIISTVRLAEASNHKPLEPDDSVAHQGGEGIGFSADIKILHGSCLGFGVLG